MPLAIHFKAVVMQFAGQVSCCEL